MDNKGYAVSIALILALVLPIGIIKYTSKSPNNKKTVTQADRKIKKNMGQAEEGRPKPTFDNVQRKVSQPYVGANQLQSTQLQQMQNAKPVVSLPNTQVGTARAAPTTRSTLPSSGAATASKGTGISTTTTGKSSGVTGQSTAKSTPSFSSSGKGATVSYGTSKNR